MIVKLVVPYKFRKNSYPSITIFDIELADMVTLVDWHNSDEGEILEQISKISISSDNRGVFYLDENNFTEKGLRHFLKTQLLRILEINNPRDYYYVDLINWDKRPPSKMTSEFDLVNFIVIEHNNGVYRILSSVMAHYKDVGTRELGEIKDKLGIEELNLEDRARYAGDEIERVVEAVRKKMISDFSYNDDEYPVLVYEKENERELREALRGTDLYDELFQ